MAAKKKTPAKKTTPKTNKAEYILVVDGDTVASAKSEVGAPHVLTHAEVVDTIKEIIIKDFAGEVDCTEFDLYKVTRVKLTLAKAEPIIKIG